MREDAAGCRDVVRWTPGSVGILLVVGVALCAFAPAAHATCMTTCEAALVHEDCAPDADGTWPADEPLTFSLTCETCCSPPGGPIECNPEAPQLDSLQLLMDGQPVIGEFVELKTVCPDGKTLYQFTGPLVPGSYGLLEGNMILLQFQVVEAPAGCSADLDCDDGVDCSQDQCIGGKCIHQMPADWCHDDSDCVAEEYCQINAEKVCWSHCASKTCWVVDCMAECDMYGWTCPEGLYCVETIKGCCGMCDPIVPGPDVVEAGPDTVEIQPEPSPEPVEVAPEAAPEVVEVVVEPAPDAVVGPEPDVVEAVADAPAGPDAVVDMGPLQDQALSDQKEDQPAPDVAADPGPTPGETAAADAAGDTAVAEDIVSSGRSSGCATGSPSSSWLPVLLLLAALGLSRSSLRRPA